MREAVLGPPLVFAQHHRRSAADRLSKAINGSRLLVDGINRAYGRRTIGFGLFPSEVREVKGHAPFRQVPESLEFWSRRREPGALALRRAPVAGGAI
jgi:hypothetical protein